MSNYEYVLAATELQEWSKRNPRKQAYVRHFAAAKAKSEGASQAVIMDLEGIVYETVSADYQLPEEFRKVPVAAKAEAN